MLRNALPLPVKKLSLAALAGAALFVSLCPSPASARKRSINWRSYYERRIPKSQSAVDRRTFIIYVFSRKGRYLSNGRKYVWSKEIFRSRVISLAVRAKRAGLGVHIMWTTRRNLSRETIERWVAASYQKRYAKGKQPRPRARGTSVAGTVWDDPRNPEDVYRFYSNGRVEVGQIRGIASNDRGTWTQRGNTVTMTIRGYRQTWTVNGNSMTYGLRVLKRRR